MISTAKTRAELATWKSKLAYRRRKHYFYEHVSKRPMSERIRRRDHWHDLVVTARHKVFLLNKKLVSINRQNVKAAAKATGVTRYDGVPVAACAVRYLQWARTHGWNGRLVSGWRDPAYSRALCFRMCGRPSCPGKCAGLSSNHVGSTPQKFALDVSDYQTFSHVMRNCPYTPRIFNALGARDPVHFSPSGN